MELVLIFIFTGLLPASLVPDWPLSPDDEEVYETVEDSLKELARHKVAIPTQYRLRWRLKSDSLPGGQKRLGSFLSLILNQKNRSANLILEKDPKESNWADFCGGGVMLREHNFRIIIGDYILHFGRGMIFAGPYARSGFSDIEDLITGSVFPRSAQENRNLRGIRIDYAQNRFAFSIAGSYSRRDARLDSSGSVSQLIFSGLHRDSSELLTKGQVGQLLSGATARIRLHPIFVTGLTVCGVRFNRSFAPQESIYSFYGQYLGQAGIYLTIGSLQRGGEIEIARSIPGGLAGSARVNVREGGLNLVLSGSVYGDRFFAPAGRRYSLTKRLNRTEMTGDAGYEWLGFWVRLRGNTYYDYLTDSVPGRLSLSAGYQVSSVGISITTGRNFRFEFERSRETRLEFNLQREVFQLLIYIGDEYLESGGAGGKLVGMNLKLKLHQVELGISAAACDIEGIGISLGVAEPGVMRSGTSYSFSKSGERMSIAAGIRIGKVGRLDVKTGLTHAQRWETDFGLQIELAN